MLTYTCVSDKRAPDDSPTYGHSFDPTGPIEIQAERESSMNADTSKAHLAEALDVFKRSEESEKLLA